MECDEFLGSQPMFAMEAGSVGAARPVSSDCHFWRGPPRRDPERRAARPAMRFERFQCFFVFSFQSDQLVTKSARETNLLLLARRGAFRFIFELTF